MQSATERESGLRGYYAVVRKRWALVLVPVLVFVGQASVYSLNQPDRYESTAMVFVARERQALLPGDGLTKEDLARLAKELAEEVSLAESDAVVDLVVAELGEIPEVGIVAPTDVADVLLFTGSALTAEDAALYANTWAEAYIQVNQDLTTSEIAAATASMQARLVGLGEEQQRLGDSPAQLELVVREIEVAVASLKELELRAEFARVGEAHLVQMAAPPAHRSNWPLSLYVALGLGVGLLVGLGLALLAERRDKMSGSAAGRRQSHWREESGRPGSARLDLGVRPLAGAHGGTDG